MAKCEACDQDMTSPDTITCEPVILKFQKDPKRYHVLPYHGTGPCEDCGVSPGGYHHVGCEKMTCPRCRKLLGSCACALDEIFEPKPPMLS